jgi:hypothetical protein
MLGGRARRYICLISIVTKLYTGVAGRNIAHVRHLGTVESVHLQDIISRLFIDDDSPVRVLGHLVVVGDNVGNGSTRILHLDSSIGREWCQSKGSVVVEGICAVLPKDGGLNTSGVRCVGVVTILRFFKESSVRAEGC